MKINPHQRDITLLFSTRIIRLFCYGFLSVILALYLTETGLTEKQIGLLFTLTLAGDAGISLWLTTPADRLWAQTHPSDRRTAHARRGHRFHPHEQHRHPDGRRHHRRHQPQRQ